MYPILSVCMFQAQIQQAGLIWGSVQAETITLQRQIEASLIDIHFKFYEFCVFRFFFVCVTKRMWKATFGKRPTSVEDNFWLETTFGGRRSSVE